jgi:hypothetical protein
MGKKKNYNFQKSISDMIATSTNSYNPIGYTERARQIVPYTKEEAEDIIRNGDSTELRELSLFFFYTSGFYRRMILYYSTMLEYVTLITPHFKTISGKSTPQVKNKYDNAIEYIDNLNIKDLFTTFAVKVFSEGAYYGLISQSENGKLENVLTLPFEYCRSHFKNYKGIAIVEFNLQYFDKIYDKEKRIACLRTFPIEIRKAYNSYKNKATSYWYQIPEEDGIYFNLCEERPFLSDIIPAIIDFNEYRIIEKNKDKQDLQKIVTQEMPHLNDGELVFEPEEVAVMHKGIVDMLASNSTADVITSFGTIKVHDLQSARSVISNNLEKISNSIYSEAGVSKELFSASNSTSLNRSLENDTALAMYLGRKFTNWLQFVVNNKFGSDNVSFHIDLLPITFFNRGDMYKNSMQGIQYGYSIMLPYLCLGIPQGHIRDLKILENDILELNEIMKPLESANTQSSSSAASTSQEGRAQAETEGKDMDNKKSEGELAAQTIKNKESGGQ